MEINKTEEEGEREKKRQRKRERGEKEILANYFTT